MSEEIEKIIPATMRGFGVNLKVAEVTEGAAVDRYALELAPGTRLTEVVRHEKDLALALGVDALRVLAPIPGTSYVGVEVPATERKIVALADLQQSLVQDHPLRFPVGVNVSGDGVSARLDRLPHLLVAGQTASGKSVFTTAMLAHLVSMNGPDALRLILVDPKEVELAPFANLPHLLRPVATEVGDAIAALEEAVDEMDERYALLRTRGVRNVEELPEGERPPYVVVVVDELADLMMMGKKRAENAVVRLLQKSRAAGIHLILATQRPSTDVVTGLIKANTPSRAVFSVSSHTDSNVALGESGAEALLGMGDMLWKPAGAPRVERVQSAFLDMSELEQILADAAVSAYLEEPDEPPLADDACMAIDEREEILGRKSDHTCVCDRDEGHAGLHNCGSCGQSWIGAGGTPPTAPTAPTPPEPVIDAGQIEAEPEPEPETMTEPDDIAAAAEASEARLAMDLAHQWQQAHAELKAMADERVSEAFEHGLQLGERGPFRRPLEGRDIWAVIGVAVLALMVGAMALPVAPFILAGVGAAWMTRRRQHSKMRPAHAPKPPKPARPTMRQVMYGGGDEDDY